MAYPNSLQRLIECFRRLPSVGNKTAERYALQVLEMNPEEVEDFASVLLDSAKNIKRCPQCGNLCEGDLCEICSDPARDHNTICVVERVKDVAAIERLGQYNGVYHVLNGTISTTKGILPEDINLASLLTKVNEETKEVIIATSSTVEGEATALYITKMLRKNETVVVTRIASGLPIGGNLDYADEMTLMRALQGRIKQ